VGETEEEGEVNKTLSDAIDETIERLRAKGGIITADGCASSLIDTLQPGQWREMALHSIASTVHRRFQRLVDKTDERQGWLPGVPQFIKVTDGVLANDDATLEQYRESEAELAARIKSYDYPRRSPEKLKRDKRTLAAMRKQDRRFAPFMAGEPEMRMGRARELYQASLETPRALRDRKGGKAKNRRNAKSTT